VKPLRCSSWNIIGLHLGWLNFVLSLTLWIKNECLSLCMHQYFWSGKRLPKWNIFHVPLSLAHKCCTRPKMCARVKHSNLFQKKISNADTSMNKSNDDQGGSSGPYVDYSVVRYLVSCRSVFVKLVVQLSLLNNNQDWLIFFGQFLSLAKFKNLGHCSLCFLHDLRISPKS